MLSSQNSPLNFLQNIIDDMKKPHEGYPHGVSTECNWGQKAREHLGTDPGRFRAATAWGQLYEERDGNPAENTRVQLRNLELYYFSKKEQKWIQLQSETEVAGDAYLENFADDINRPANDRDESDNGGGLSVTAGDGYNYHFWPKSGRVPIAHDDIAIIFSTCQARLVVDDPSKPDDRHKARYILSVGGDYWLSVTARWDYYETNNDFAIGRFKYVTNEWQAFNAWAGDEELLRKNPPPIR